MTKHSRVTTQEALAMCKLFYQDKKSRDEIAKLLDRSYLTTNSIISTVFGKNMRRMKKPVITYIDYDDKGESA